MENKIYWSEIGVRIWGTKGAMVCYNKVRQIFITKCDKCYYKVRQVLQSVTILLQSATGITKCDDYYKVRQYKALKVIII